MVKADKSLIWAMCLWCHNKHTEGLSAPLKAGTSDDFPLLIKSFLFSEVYHLFHIAGEGKK